MLVLSIHPAASAADDARPVEDAARFRLDPRAKNGSPTIFLEDDSTVRVGTPNERGWDNELASFFDPAKINVANKRWRYSLPTDQGRAVTPQPACVGK